MGHSKRRNGECNLGDRGAVLVITLLIAAVLTLLGITFVSLSSTEVSIAFGEARLLQAFNLAEAGIAEAKRILRDSADWDTELAASPFTCPGGLVPAGDGECTITITNDTADGGGPTDDTNDLVIVQATGTYLGTTKGVEIAVNRLMVPPPAGGITSVGVATNVSFAGNSFSVDGNNWIPPNGGNPEVMDNSACGSTTAPKFGISVPDATQQLTVKNDLSATQQDNVTGAAPNPPWAPPGPTPSVGVDVTMTQTQLEALVDQLMPLADVSYTPGTQISSGTLGTQSDPKITVVDATGYTGSDPALKLSATNGAGILIVKNGTLEITGNSDWVGIIIVIGSNVQIDMAGGGDKSIYGSVLLAENLDVAAPSAEGQGSVRVRYSCQGVNVANSAGGGKLNGAAAWWREVF